MELFASPMACSLASHITALEAGLPVKVRFVENKKTDDGGDYFQISAKGYVPALRLDDGQILNEGPSVLQYLADAQARERPGAGLGHGRALPADRHAELPVDRAAQAHLLQRVQPQRRGRDQGRPPARCSSRPSTTSRRSSATGDYLVGNTFTVADAYLVTMLNWAVFLKVDLAKWPTIAAYHQKHLKRPSVVKAMGVEMAERQRRAA